MSAQSILGGIAQEETQRQIADDAAVLSDAVQSTANSADDLSNRTLRDVLDPAHPQFIPPPVAPAGIDTPGQRPSANSFPVVLPAEQVDDANLQAVIPAGTKSVGRNAITGDGSWLDVSRYRSFMFQCQTPAGVTVSYVIEGSNDGVGVVTMYMLDANSAGAYPNTSVAQAANTNRFWEGPIKYRYIRVRITTAVAGGNFATFTRLSMAPWVSTFNPALNPSYVQSNVSSGSNATSGVLPQSTAAMHAIGGVDTSIPMNSVSTGQNKYRLLRTDIVGNQTVVGPDPTTAAGVSMNPVLVKPAPGDSAAWSERDLLTMILAELRVMNLYLKEMPSVMNAGSRFADEPQYLVSDPTLIM